MDMCLLVGLEQIVLVFVYPCKLVTEFLDWWLLGNYCWNMLQIMKQRNQMERDQMEENVVDIGVKKRWFR